MWVGLVLTGKLIPHKTAQARIDDIKAAHIGEMQYRDRENERLAGERDYERKAKDVERERADQNAERLGLVVREFGETTVHLLRSLPEAADQ